MHGSVCICVLNGSDVCADVLGESLSALNRMPGLINYRRMALC